MRGGRLPMDTSQNPLLTAQSVLEKSQPTPESQPAKGCIPGYVSGTSIHQDDRWRREGSPSRSLSDGGEELPRLIRCSFFPFCPRPSGGGGITKTAVYRVFDSFPSASSCPPSRDISPFSASFKPLLWPFSVAGGDVGTSPEG